MRPAGVDAESHLTPFGHGLERGHLERDELHLAVLVVDPALDEEDPVRLEQVARRGVRRVESDHLDRAGEVVEADEGHWISLARRETSERADDAADRDDVAVPPAVHLGDRHVDLAAQLFPDSL